MLPELHQTPLGQPALLSEYSSSRVTLDHNALRELLQPYLRGELNGVDG